MPPLRTMPDICGKFADTWAVRTPRTTSGRSPGATTTAPSNSRSSTLGIVIAATTTPVASCASSRSSPLISVPSQASHHVADRGRAQQRLAPAARTPVRRSAASAASTSSAHPGSARLATTANSVAVVGLQLRRAPRRPWPCELLGRLAVGVEDEHHRAAQVGRDPGVEGELGRRADVGVVAAHDDHGVGLLGHLVVALDDPVRGRVRVRCSSS